MPVWEEAGGRFRHWAMVVLMGIIFAPLVVTGGMAVIRRQAWAIRGRGMTQSIEVTGGDAVFYGLILLVPGLLGVGAAAWYWWVHLAGRER